MLFGMLVRTVWQSFHEIFERFGKASGMEENLGKSCIYFEEAGKVLANEIATMFSVSAAPLSQGFKYLGFHMKLNNYQIKDWDWLAAKVKKKISSWTSKWLSSGGRFILV